MYFSFSIKGQKRWNAGENSNSAASVLLVLLSHCCPISFFVTLRKKWSPRICEMKSIWKMQKNLVSL